MFCFKSSPGWVFTDLIPMRHENLIPGLQTHEDVLRQLDTDLHRFYLFVDEERITQTNTLLNRLESNDIQLIRCCTQAVFGRPLETAMSFLPYHTLIQSHEHKTCIFIRRIYPNTWWSYVYLQPPNKYHFRISITFRPIVTKTLEVDNFLVHTEFAFTLGEANALFTLKTNDVFPSFLNRSPTQIKRP